jgi:gliding motility-associated-like protein
LSKLVLLATSFTDISTAPASVVPSTTVWNFGDGTGSQTFAAGATFGHVFALPNTYTVTMHTVSAYGCLSTDTSALVTIDANHHIALTSGNSNQNVCVNRPIANITYTISGGATNVSIPALPAGLSYNVAGQTLTISGAPTSAAGSPYNFTIQTTGNTCLQDQASVTITVQPDHTLALTSGNDMQSVCVNSAIDDITYDLGGGANSATVSGLPAGVTYTINGTILTIKGTPSTTVGTPFAFSIQTSGNACVQASATGEIKVNPYPVPSFTFDNTSYCIPNALVGFNNTTTPAPTNLYTYLWKFDEPSSGANDSSKLVNPSHLYSSAGPFNVTLTATSTVVLNNNVIGCAASKTSLLNFIHPQPKADFVFNKQAVCIGDNVTITDNTDGKDGIVNKWFWNLGDGTSATNNPVTHTYPDTATYIITMYSVNSFGCHSDTINKLPVTNPYKPFTVYPYPYINIGPDRSLLEGGQITLEPSVYARQPQYLWTPSQYLNQNNVRNPTVVKPLTDMTYTLTVTGQGGCALSKSVFVKLLRFPTIPNTFTPNHDGINDEWRIDFLNTYPDNRVQIFTRSGQLVFESKGYNKPWDGTVKGKPLPFDTYYYIIEPGSGRDPITGYVTIIK